MKFHPASNIELHQLTGDLYEACIRRTADIDTGWTVFTVVPLLQEYKTGDAFSPHPSDPDLWQFRGRIDDMQVSSTGKKYHPTSIQQHIATHPDIQEALPVGTPRPHPALYLR